MAMVTITLRDGDDDGQVDIRLESEPAIPAGDAEQVTSAQHTALLMLDAVASPEDIV